MVTWNARYAPCLSAASAIIASGSPALRSQSTEAAIEVQMEARPRTPAATPVQAQPRAVDDRAGRVVRTVLVSKAWLVMRCSW